jgi:hypothetical protein
MQLMGNLVIAPRIGLLILQDNLIALLTPTVGLVNPELITLVGKAFSVPDMWPLHR